MYKDKYISLSGLAQSSQDQSSLSVHQIVESLSIAFLLHKVFPNIFRLQ